MRCFFQGTSVCYLGLSAVVGPITIVQRTAQILDTKNGQIRARGYTPTQTQRRRKKLMMRMYVYEYRKYLMLYPWHLSEIKDLASES